MVLLLNIWVEAVRLETFHNGFNRKNGKEPVLFRGRSLDKRGSNDAKSVAILVNRYSPTEPAARRCR